MTPFKEENPPPRQPFEPGSLYVRQLALGPMENFVYLLGAPEAPEVVVVDPAWDVPAIEAAAAEDGKTLCGVVVSHSHHDHINGLAELLSRHDVPVYAQREELAFSSALRKLGDVLHAVSPGDEVSAGPARLKLLHTPGHTPGSQCVLSRGALVTGDTAFVNACGRCDLEGGNPEDLFRTLDQLSKLPSETRLYPGHDYGDVPVSTVARERAQNPYFQLHDLGAFVAYRMRPRK